MYVHMVQWLHPLSTHPQKGGPMKTTLALLLSVLLLAIPFTGSGTACSTFVLKNNGLQIFGRNYDWSLGDALLVVNKRGCRKDSITRPGKMGAKAEWIAKYGSVTFNQYGRELPTGGINEAGLVVESMALSETRFPESDHRPYIGTALQWRQFLLDTCATVAEVIATDLRVRVSSRTRGPGTHVLVLDKHGDCAAIEFLDGRMVVHRGTDLPVAVLTNDTYARSVQYLNKGRAPLADPYNSITRFIKAARMVQDCRAISTGEMTTYAFDILETVSAPRTQWRIVYDNQNMQVHFFTRTNSRMRRFDVLDFDFSPATPVKILDVDAGSGGDVAGRFSEYTYAANRDLIGRSFGKTSFLSVIPAERLDATARIPERFVCRQRHGGL